MKSEELTSLPLEGGGPHRGGRSSTPLTNYSKALNSTKHKTRHSAFGRVGFEEKSFIATRRRTNVRREGEREDRIKNYNVTKKFGEF